jgi:hypothetical protein
MTTQAPFEIPETRSNWIDVDLDGFGQLMASRPKVAILHDLIQNVFDENATTAEIMLKSIDDEHASLVVEDDCPEGFADLTDAYTMYQPSKKKGDPTKRGRFNEGEKFVLSQCVKASISTTTGSVFFDERGRTVTSDRRKSGSVFSGVVRLNREEVREILCDVTNVLVPDGFTVTINGFVIEGREPVKQLMGISLPTLRMDKNGQMKPTRRNTCVDIIAAEVGGIHQQAHLYEMGIPVVEIDTPWHINVGQKVPLNRDRDNVTPAYRRALLGAVLEETHNLLNKEEISAVWVTDAVPAADEDTVQSVMNTRHGKGWVIGTPSDREADKNAIAHGKEVVNGGTYSRDVWTAIKESEAAVSSATDFSLKPTGKPGNLKEAEVTPLIKALKTYCRKAAMFLEDEDHFEINVFDDSNWQSEAALHMTRRIDINWLVLRRAGWGTMTTKQLGQAIDDLMIHECAHKDAPDHFTTKYYNACTALGAKFRTSSLKWRMDPQECK